MNSPGLPNRRRTRGRSRRVGIRANLSDPTKKALRPYSFSPLARGLIAAIAKLTANPSVAGSVRITPCPAYADDSNEWPNQRGPTVELKIDIKAKATGIQEFDLKLDETGLETIAGFVEGAAVRSKRKKD